MPNSGFSKVLSYLANHAVSWTLELLVLGVVAWYTISETRKTAQQTREMLTKYDAVISAYAKEKSEVVDHAASAAVAKIKQKADGMTKETVIDVLQSLKKPQVESHSRSLRAAASRGKVLRRRIRPAIWTGIA